VFFGFNSSNSESVDGDSDLVDNEFNVVDVYDVFKMNLNTSLVMNLNRFLNSVSNLLVVNLDLLDDLLSLNDFNLDLLDDLLGLLDSLDDSLLGSWFFNVFESESQSDDSSVDDISSVDSDLSSNDDSLSSDDLSGSVDLKFVVSEFKSIFSDSQFEFSLVVSFSGKVEFELVDVDSWFDDISSV
jgi:hypothetical protein